ncbi:hypothetical protein ONZ51_g11280 [Trametes cubensis]|uniref:Uncharacterized protein n=1 Tax=Trametes cubensis TaxID=1111947 RepID=A0AAD7X5Y1_9APHY|nr:hypothetical protein ONZ51_g11280 [Trametes cubensis]
MLTSDEDALERHRRRSTAEEDDESGVGRDMEKFRCYSVKWGGQAGAYDTSFLIYSDVIDSPPELTRLLRHGVERLRG